MFLASVLSQLTSYSVYFSQVSLPCVNAYGTFSVISYRLQSLLSYILLLYPTYHLGNKTTLCLKKIHVTTSSTIT